MEAWAQIEMRSICDRTYKVRPLDRPYPQVSVSALAFRRPLKGISIPSSFFSTQFLILLLHSIIWVSPPPVHPLSWLPLSMVAHPHSRAPTRMGWHTSTRPQPTAQSQVWHDKRGRNRRWTLSEQMRLPSHLYSSSRLRRQLSTFSGHLLWRCLINWLPTRTP